MTEKYKSREERRKLQAKRKNRKGKKGFGVFVKRLFLILIVLGIIGMLAGGIAFAYYAKDAPPLDEKLLKDPISSHIFDKDGNLIAEIGAEKRDYVSYEDIPDHVKEAILATEDVRFYKHHGIDLIRLGGAVVANVTEGFGSEGASTITQQVIKMSFLTPEKTLKRKAQEAWLSVQLEQKYTKEEIFEMYVNKVWMDSGGHGIATAAKVYFGKTLDEVTLSEAALLAGIPQSPANYNPFKHPDKAEKRRNVVLSLMHKHGFISKEEMEEAKAVDVTSTLVPEEERKGNEIPYDHFIGQVVKEITEKYPDINPYSDGLKIYTTMDKDAQQYLEDLLAGKGDIEFPDDKFQAGITLLDTKTGEILALGGGRKQKDVTFGFNYATDAKRQPGSVIKPILDYGPAIEYLKWGTYYALEDKPYTYSSGDPINNWDNRHMGIMTMRQALALSRNIPALQAFQAVGPEKAKEFAANVGIELKEIYESYSIGGFGGKDEGVSTLEMAGAFSAFGNNGFYTEPHSVKKIELQDGTVIDMKPESKVAMQDYTAFMISDMLKDVVTSGTGTRVNIPGLPIAGKTGTTNYTKEEKRKYNIASNGVPDAWFVGYTTVYTAAVWTGYDNKFENSLVGDEQRIAQRIFRSVMAHMSKDIETPDFSVPNSVEKVRIEKGTLPAKLASENTPEDQVLYEYAVKGHGPKEVSTKYEKLAAPSGFTADYDEASGTINLSWDHSEDDVQFQLSMSVDGGGDQALTTTADKQYQVSAQPGRKYTFKLVALRGNMTSDPVSATVDLSGTDNETEENPDDGEVDDENGNSGNRDNNNEENGNGSRDDKGKDKENGNNNNGNRGNNNNGGSGEDRTDGNENGGRNNNENTNENRQPVEEETNDRQQQQQPQTNGQNGRNRQELE